jgi:hypothetical protein
MFEDFVNLKTELEFLVIFKILLKMHQNNNFQKKSCFLDAQKTGLIIIFCRPNKTHNGNHAEQKKC